MYEAVAWERWACVLSAWSTIHQSVAYSPVLAAGQCHSESRALSKIVNPVLALTAGREGEEETGGHRLRQRDRGHQKVRPSRPLPNLYPPEELI